MDLTLSNVHQLVLYYLLDNGFENSAKALYDILKPVIDHPHTEIYNSEFKKGLNLNIINEILSMSKIRAHLCDLISKGLIKEFIEELGLCYPELLKDQEFMFFATSQMFIEMIRNSNPITETLALGMEIQQRLASLQENGESDIRESYLEELYALIAYKDPLQSPLAHLFSQDQRTKLMDAFERSLQKIDKGKREDPLQMSWKQLKLINNILLEKGNPESAFTWML